METFKSKQYLRFLEIVFSKNIRAKRSKQKYSKNTSWSKRVYKIKNNWRVLAYCFTIKWKKAKANDHISWS